MCVMKTMERVMRELEQTDVPISKGFAHLAPVAGGEYMTKFEGI